MGAYHTQAPLAACLRDRGSVRRVRRPTPRNGSADLASGLQLHGGADTLCVQLEEGPRRPWSVFGIGQLPLDRLMQELQASGRTRFQPAEGAVQQWLHCMAP